MKTSAAATPVAASAAPGLRERNKLAKLARIKQAARDLFVSRGYDNTTTREIARVADVGLGTLFTYAADKRDLLFLIMNEELEAMTTAAAEQMKVRGTIEQQLHEIFHPRYLLFARQPSLSRFMLREQQFYTDTEQASRFQATRMRALLLVHEAVMRAQRSGILRRTLDAALAARLIFAVYQMELRDWLAREPLNIAHGEALLSRSLAMLLDGMRPAAGPAPPKPSRGAKTPKA